MLRPLILAACCLLAAGCDEKVQEAERRPEPPAPVVDKAALATQATEARLRQESPSATLRDLRSYAQVAPQTMAICGQVRRSAGEAFVPFVAVVRFEAGNQAAVTDTFAATSSVGATRTYVESTSRCRADGGPNPAHRGVPPLPPLPDQRVLAGDAMVARPGATPIATVLTPVANAATPGAQAASGSVTTRGHANVRESPRGGGAVLRTVSPGTALTVYGTAPGGWFEVGDASGSFGWVHNSLLAVN